jgi:hypothetical protein
MPKRPTQKREVDKRKTSKALRKLRRVAERASEEGGPGLTTWEKEFVEGVSGRLEKYGSAFRDPSKGRLEEALSSRQTHIVRVIDKKARKPAKKAATPDDDKSRQPNSTFRRKPLNASGKASGKVFGKAGSKAKWTPRVRDINDDPVRAQPATSDKPDTPERRRIHLKVVPGGKTTGRGR